MTYGGRVGCIRENKLSRMVYWKACSRDWKAPRDTQPLYELPPGFGPSSSLFRFPFPLPLCAVNANSPLLSSLKDRAPPFAASLSPASITLVLEFSSASENSLPFFLSSIFESIDRIRLWPQNSLHSLVNLSIAFYLVSANLFDLSIFSFLPFLRGNSRTTQSNVSLLPA